MTDKQKKYLENLGVNIIDLTKISRDELSDEDREFVSFVESTGGIITEIFHF